MSILNRPIDPQTPAEARSEIAYEIVGRPSDKSKRLLVWAHGWGQNREFLRRLASAFPRDASLLFDFPGFGASPAPVREWGTADYAEAMARLIASIKKA